MASRKAVPAERRHPVAERTSSAPHQQSASGATTWVSHRGAGTVRLPSDRLRLGGGTITKAEHDRQMEGSTTEGADQ